MDNSITFTQVPEFINQSNQSLDYSSQRPSKSEILLKPESNYELILKFSIKLELSDLIDWVNIK
jgi:hypothetical protein